MKLHVIMVKVQDGVLLLKMIQKHLRIIIIKVILPIQIGTLELITITALWSGEATSRKLALPIKLPTAEELVQSTKANWLAYITLTNNNKNINHNNICNDPINLEKYKHPLDPKFNEYISILQTSMKKYINAHC
mgnify:CR=1 FL=1